MNNWTVCTKHIYKRNKSIQGKSKLKLNIRGDLVYMVTFNNTNYVYMGLVIAYAIYVSLCRTSYNTLFCHLPLESPQVQE